VAQYHISPVPHFLTPPFFIYYYKNVVHPLQGNEFNFDGANDYYSQFRGAEFDSAPKIFACTDVTFLEDRLYVVTGYCDGDFVLSAHKVDGKWQWGTCLLQPEPLTLPCPLP
jgi:hypothetical protein